MDGNESILESASFTEVSIYTDGSALGNPGRGGFAAILCASDSQGVLHEREISQGFRLTTNNRMELLSVIVALEALLRPCRVVLHSDSQYVVNAFNEGWIESWQARGWKTADNKPVKNFDLWQRLLVQTSRHRVVFEWVKGHAGNSYNERCDRLAKAAADSDDLAVDDGYEGTLAG